MLADDKTRVGYQDAGEVKSVPTREDLLPSISTMKEDLIANLGAIDPDKISMDHIKNMSDEDTKKAYNDLTLKNAAREKADKEDELDRRGREALEKHKNRTIWNKGGLLSDDKDRMAYAEGEEVGTHIMPDGTEMAGSTHAEYEEELDMLPDEEMDMVPDEEMEQDHLDFIINESLDTEEEMYLMEILQADDRLSMIFDKVMDTASEFSGDGPVEGLGTEESDSIPARLSDGEFVMTAQATDEIGSDNLQNMMDSAEEASEDRQQVAIGGEVQDESQLDQFGKVVDEDLADEEIRRSMLSVNPRLQ